jgi:hypothetical protein
VCVCTCGAQVCACMHVCTDLVVAFVYETPTRTCPTLSFNEHMAAARTLSSNVHMAAESFVGRSGAHFDSRLGYLGPPSLGSFLVVTCGRYVQVMLQYDDMCAYLFIYIYICICIHMCIIHICL